MSGRNIRNIVLATRNQGKIREIRSLLSDIPVAVSTLDDYDGIPDVIEDGQSFLENARKKASLTARHTGEISLADDSGLEVDCLCGAPGISSAIYAGPKATDEMNIEKLLREMQGVKPDNRGAVFRCELVLSWPDGEYISFAGSWRGVICESPQGSGGFGYDPVFFIPDCLQTAAQMTTEMKNRLSHRAQAFQKLSAWLRKA